ncbi:MAG: 5-oxoprolinase subunit PxpB [Hyphomicrobiaceae bacterium]|nr:MAG: 5-oxoprolinase subunit PxpB [Hyphomicrobiaceae bacterium]
MRVRNDSLIRVLPCGDTALVIELGNVVDKALNARVLALAAAIERAAILGVSEVVPTFRSLMLHYDPLQTSHDAIKKEIEPLIGAAPAELPPGRRWTLPVCYEPEFGLDLEEVSRRLAIPQERVIELHAGTPLRVYMLGFLPGAPYLGDTAKELALPRRENPRVKVPRGSVAIALNQSVVYPFESPGGWHILGRTPVRLYDQRRESPVLLRPNDEVRFLPVSRARHDDLERRAEAGEAIELDVAELAS